MLAVISPAKFLFLYRLTGLSADTDREWVRPGLVLVVCEVAVRYLQPPLAVPSPATACILDERPSPVVT